MTDQQRADTMGYAVEDAPCTRLTSLARSGVAFTNAYSAATVCAPARASLLSGKLHHRVATTSDGLTLREGEWTIARALKDRGYDTALFGKMHLNPMRADHGFETSVLCEHLTTSAGYAPSAMDDYRAWLVSQGKQDERFRQPSMPRAFPYESRFHPTAFITERASEFVSKRDRDRPYFAVVSYPHPHTPYDPPEPYFSRFRPENEALPTPGVDVNESLPPAFRRAVFEGDKPGGFYPTRVRDVSEAYVTGVLAAIRALVSHLDEAISDLLRCVDLNDTFVWFTSDHGDFGGHRGLLGKIPWIPFDDLAKVPTFCLGYGVSRTEVAHAPMQSFDFCATALDLAGAPPNTMDAKSLTGFLAGREPLDETRPVYCATSQGWPMVRLGALKQIWHPHSGERLIYDLAADPDETENRLATPGYGSFVERSSSLLEETLASK